MIDRVLEKALEKGKDVILFVFICLFLLIQFFGYLFMIVPNILLLVIIFLKDYITHQKTTEMDTP